MKTEGRRIIEPSERFWRYVKKDNDGCWIWSASLCGRGYGQFWGGKASGIVMAHRFSYELHVGKIPPGLVIDHLCRNTKCVRPDHLEAVTYAENTRRGDAHERRREAELVRETCRNGHSRKEFSFFDSSGNRLCRACSEISARNSYLHRRTANSPYRPNHLSPIRIVAEYFGVSRQTAWKWLKGYPFERGRMPPPIQCASRKEARELAGKDGAIAKVIGAH
jgi:hypothetical protein